MQGGSAEWGDYDGDGDLDLMVTGEDNGDTKTATIYENDVANNNGFSAIGADLRGVYLGSSDWGNYDGDGDLDLVVTGRDEITKTATIYRNEVSPDIADIHPRSGVPGTAVRIYGSGFNSGGIDDVTIGGQSASITDVRNNGSTAMVTVPSGSSGGVVDVTINFTSGATVTRSGAFTVLTGGPGEFSDLGAGLTGVDYSSSEWGDYDGDGDLDLVVTGDDGDTKTTTIYRNEGGETFTAIGAGLTGVDDGSLDWGDYDGDGDLDLVVTGKDDNSNETATIYRNDGGGTFTAIGAGLTGVANGSAEWGDYDGDGKLDLVVTGSETGDLDYGTATIYRNYGGGTFTAIGASLTGVWSSSSNWGDYDGDGDLDLMITGGDESSNYTARIYENKGGGTFTAIGAGLKGVYGGSSDWGDYDGDGDLDLVVTGDDGDTKTTTIYRNEGGGTFTSIGAGLTGVFLGSSKWGDYDGDGDLDLVVTGQEVSFRPLKTATIYRNEGDGTFAAIGAGLTDVASSSANWGDYDGDGDLDLVVTGLDESGSPTATIYQNVVTQPAMVTAQVNRSFGGADGPEDYRLVALPGQVDRPIEESIGGKAGQTWQAYRDDGSSSDFLVKYDSSAAFTFKPGRGFWLTSRQGWQSSHEVPTVDLTGGIAEIPLRDGWNVISNPLNADVSWSAVEAENVDTQSGASLEPIWAFDGTFTNVVQAGAGTFASAKSGRAYYFFNDKELNTLKIPYPGATKSKIRAGEAHAKNKVQATRPSGRKDRPSGGKGSTLALTARPAEEPGAPGSTVRVGLHPEASPSAGPKDRVAPPARFAKVALRARAPSLKDGSSKDNSAKPASKRMRSLMADRRPASEMGEGYTYSLRLQRRSEGAVTIVASGLQAFSDRSVALLHSKAGSTYDLQEKKRAQIPGSAFGPDGTATLQVAIGTEGYVQKKSQNALPDEVTFVSYPNPVRQQGTLEYTLPEAADVTLRVYDMLGRQVATLASGQQEAGRHRVLLEATRLSSGVYFGRLTAADVTRTQKITIVR